MRRGEMRGKPQSGGHGRRPRRHCDVDETTRATFPPKNRNEPFWKRARL